MDLAISSARFRTAPTESGQKDVDDKSEACVESAIYPSETMEQELLREKVSIS